MIAKALVPNKLGYATMPNGQTVHVGSNGELLPMLQRQADVVVAGMLSSDVLLLIAHNDPARFDVCSRVLATRTTEPSDE